MRQPKRFEVLCAMLLLVLVVSSSMTYQQQTSVPILQQILPQKPFLNQLQKISFVYAGQVHSVETMGYYKLLEFFIRKLAHFTIYFLLGTFCFLGFQQRVQGKVFKGVILWLAVIGLMGILLAGLILFKKSKKMK